MASDVAPALLSAWVVPSLAPLDENGTQLSVTHRRVIGGELHYVFNESFAERSEQLRVAGAFARLTLLDPDTGEQLPTMLDGDVVALTLGPARGVVLYIER